MVVPKLKPASLYIVKPPRVIVRSNHYYLKFYLRGRKRPIERATGLPVITEAMDAKERRSIERRLQEKVDEIVALRAAVKLGHRAVDLESPKPRVGTFQELLSGYNKENAIRAGRARSKKTLLHRTTAVRFLERSLPALPATLTRAQVIGLRDRALQTLSPASLRGYFVELRMLMAFAVEQGYARENPFHKVPVHVPDEEPVIVPDSLFERMVQFLFTANQQHPELTSGLEILAPILIERFTAIRGQDVLNIDLSKYDADKRELRFYNSKGKRWETQPVSDALAIVLAWRHVSTLRSVGTVTRYLQSFLEGAGIPNAYYAGQWYTVRDLEKKLKTEGVETRYRRIGTHHFKKMLADDLDSAGVPDRIVTLALHHAPAGETATMQKHYARNKTAWLEALNRTQARYVPLLRSLSDLPPDTNRYVLRKRTTSAKAKRHSKL